MLLENQAAYILHCRHFKDDDALVDCFSCDQGRFRAILPGLYKSSKNKAYLRGMVQPFTALSLSYKNQSDLKKITRVEAASAAMALQGKYLFSGLYINELLLRLTPLAQANPDLFGLYIETLGELMLQRELEPLLRRFELSLLRLLGLAHQLDRCHDRPLEAGINYFFDPQNGLRVATVTDPVRSIFSAADLQALAKLELSQAQQQLAAKRLMRHWLQHHLGSKPLASRALFSK